MDNDALFYADDTMLYSSHPPDSMNHRQALQNDLDRIRQFGADWAITFNAQKTVQQTFTNVRDNRDQGRNFIYLRGGTCHPNLKICHLNAPVCHPNVRRPSWAPQAQ